MIRTPLTFLVALAGVGLACGQTPPREPMRGVKRGDKQPAVPALIVGVNAAIGTVAEPGWPLIVSAIPNVDGQATTPPLPADLEVRMFDANGGPVALRFEALTPPAVAPGRYWVAAEAATAQLAPGRYRVSVASVAAPNGMPAGWKVEAGQINVLTPAAERQGRLSLLRIHHWLLRGREDEAVAEANRAVAANPRDAQAWVAKGDVLLQRDDPDGAVEAYDRALDLHRGDKLQPYPILRRRHAAHLRALEKRGVVSPAAPP